MIWKTQLRNHPNSQYRLVDTPKRFFLEIWELQDGQQGRTDDNYYDVSTRRKTSRQEKWPWRWWKRWWGIGPPIPAPATTWSFFGGDGNSPAWALFWKETEPERDQKLLPWSVFLILNQFDSTETPPPPGGCRNTIFVEDMFYCICKYLYKSRNIRSGQQIRIYIFMHVCI